MVVTPLPMSTVVKELLLLKEEMPIDVTESGMMMVFIEAQF